MSEDNPGESPRPRLGLRGVLLALGGVALCVALWSARRHPAPAPQAPEPAPAVLPTRLAPQELSPSEAEQEAAPVAGYRREVVRPKAVQNVALAAEPKEETPAEPEPGGPQNHRRDEKKTLPEIFRMPGAAAGATAAPAVPAPSPAPETAPEAFAPFGRLIKCQLVQTIDSVTARSEPIVALVTEDVDWNGTVIIPAGTEAFSYAAPAAVLDVEGVGRLVDTGEWTLVLPGGPADENGRELILRGRAVDRRETQLAGKGRAESWALDDGADGLVGYTLSTLDNREIRLFAAAAISGLTQGIAAVAERQEPAPGISGVLGATQVAPTIGNALAASIGTGAVDAVNEVAARIREEISKRGVYVRVPAGKTFYLFVEQTIDPGRAQVGLRLPSRPRPAP